MSAPTPPDPAPHPELSAAPLAALDEATAAALDCLDIVRDILLFWGVRELRYSWQIAEALADGDEDEACDKEHEETRRMQIDGRESCRALLDQLAARLPAWQTAIESVADQLTEARPVGVVDFDEWEAPNAHLLALELARCVRDWWFLARLHVRNVAEPARGMEALLAAAMCDAREVEEIKTALRLPADPRDDRLWRTARHYAQRADLPPQRRVRSEIEAEAAWAAKAAREAGPGDRAAPQKSEPPVVQWEGDDWDALEPLVRRLLTYMNGREQAELKDLFPVVWGREYADGEGRSDLSTALSKANGFLDKRQSRRTLHKRRGEAVVFWG
jgi:hypothetical protein